ncbi:MAG: DUF2236 domain-containing protein [Thermoleophilaceae bacterium]|nr:DUF2236 domain-containing protein [Thermoleophilaceae bacterium]
MQTEQMLTHGATRLPSRFRENEPRARRLARPLLRFGGIGPEIDESLMARIGAALMQRDEPGAALADAIRMRVDGPARVTQQQLRAAMRSGIAGVEACPPALAEFMAVVSHVPDWVDWELIDQGASVLRRMGPNGRDVLEQLALVGGYRFGGPGDLLVATGGLTGGRTLRRLAETQHWTVTLAEPGSLRPGTESWRLTVYVRAMHALVNSTYESKWDVDRWGLPINQADQLGTLGLFSGTLLLGCRMLGVPISQSDAHAFMHMWKYVGWLMGVDPSFLTDDEHEAHRLAYHVLLAAPNVSDAGPLLAQSVHVAIGERRFDRWPAGLQQLRGRLERERFLSMLNGFVGVEGMRELDLPRRLPWALALVVMQNVIRYRVIDRLHGGPDRRERIGREVALALVASYFAGEQADVGDLPG